jgi:hypothetical protein
MTTTEIDQPLDLTDSLQEGFTKEYLTKVTGTYLENTLRDLFPEESPNIETLREGKDFVVKFGQEYTFRMVVDRIWKNTEATICQGSST